LSAGETTHQTDGAWSIAGIQYTLVQGIGRHQWKWAAAVHGIKISGQGSSRDEAIADAEKAIDRALAPKKRRLKRD
jgi:hypothetical protein